MKLKPWWKRQWPFLCLPDCYKPFCCPVLVLIVPSLNFTTRSSLSCLSSISMHSFKSYCLTPRSLVFCFSSHPLCKAALWGQRNMEHRGRDRELGKQLVFCYTWLHLFLSTHTLLSPIVSRTDHVNLSLTAFAKVLCLLWHFSSSDDTADKQMPPSYGAAKNWQYVCFRSLRAREVIQFQLLPGNLECIFPSGSMWEKGQSRQQSTEIVYITSGTEDRFILPRSSPEIVNLCGLCPVHKPT